ncbi:MAG: hypothetical protein HRU70_12395 [Phycisphaeraceae bacterium]|nr:MAG: hypothetical protein HRU70_12395 [Phycisphaeraceae bacterium]
MASLKGKRVAVWVDPARAELARRVLAWLDAPASVAGSPARGQSRAVAAALGAEPADDLRRVLVEGEVDVVWVVDAGEFGEPGDASSLSAAHARGVKVVTRESIPGSALDAASSAWGVGGGSVDGPSPAWRPRVSPLIRSGRSYREAGEVLSEIGAVRAVCVEALSSAWNGTLGGLLYDAADVVRALLGEPESVHAAYGPGNAPVASPSVAPGSLRGLEGDLFATLRYADGRVGSMVLSGRGGGWRRRVTVLGERGRVTVSGAGFERHTPEGERADSTRYRGPKDAWGEAVREVGESLARASGSAGLGDSPGGALGALTICQTALLSAKTGQAESPATIRRMIEVG